MSYIESEAKMEERLIEQLKGIGYKYCDVKNEKDLESNLREMLVKQNNVELSDNEFKQILIQINKGDVFDKAETLRGWILYKKDDGTTAHVQLFDTKDWCKNQFQVANQIEVEGRRKNRYDVTILINGLPLIQVELKRRGMEIKEAFNQVNRYHRDSYKGLFEYIQIFIISNGVNTKYYSNHRGQSFKQTFYWLDEKNNYIKDIKYFAETFLEPCTISKMIARYVVLHQSDRMLLVLRSYQYHAVERMIRHAAESKKNGYIWHTTGSGKTLTSFKASQILEKMGNIDRVVFVVDRKDLDYQTVKEFNAFAENSVDGTDKTDTLVKQFENPNTKLIVTTLQKLNVAISRQKHLESMNAVKDKRTIFIFDECHRSQFGDTHTKIKEFFTNHQMFGFTGTPIFGENATGIRTTKDLFDEMLHKYIITDAIAAENVLRFSVEYIGRYDREKKSNANIDIKVEDIDTKEVLESEDRINKITKHIVENHKRKTHNKDFTAIFCVDSISMLKKYYTAFKKIDHDLNIATIFSYSVNEEDVDADGIMDDTLKMQDENAEQNQQSRDFLDNCIKEYNDKFKTNYSTESNLFYGYYKNIAKRVRDREIDILLVVNMFLTGFDSKSLNTLYVDKTLKYHGLLQAFSRTNRILNEKKSQGNIVCFRNLKKNVDSAITLFSDGNPIESVIVEPYEQLIEKFNELIKELDKVDAHSKSETDQKAFIELLEK